MTIFDEQSGLKSGSLFSKKNNNSLTIPLMLLLLIRAKHNSIALLQKIISEIHSTNKFHLIIVDILGCMTFKKQYPPTPVLFTRHSKHVNLT